ncbi:LytTR family DNA-binding domain-containing protein [soil metagenome]
MNCVIIDDNKLARNAIRQLISQFDFLEIANEFSNPVEAFNFIESAPIDLIFLDVEMPQMSGLDLAKNLKSKPIIILITSKTDYATEAFSLNVADYLLKPITLSRFMVSVNRAKELFDQKNQKVEFPSQDKEYIFVRTNSILTKIKIAEIQYLQALGDYVTIFTNEKRFTVHITLSGIQEKLPTDKFYRLHRSYLIALDQITSIEENTAYIQKNPVPIGEPYKQILLKKLNLI